LVIFLLSAFSGALLSGAFEPIDKWWLAPLAIALHMHAMNKSDRKFVSVAIFALFFNLFLLHWSSMYVGALPWIILSIGLSLFYLPLVLVKRWGMASYPLIFIVLEEVRNRFPFNGFGWARLAYSQPDAPYALLARYGGAVGLSAITVIIALALYQISQQRLQILVLLPLMVLIIPVNVETTGHTQVLLIQGNVPTLGLDFNSRATQVFLNHVEESKKALVRHPKVDFLLWPENAVDVDPFSNTQVKNLLDSFTTPLIVGAIVQRNAEVLNTSILWTKDAQNIYSKQHLTPFGEYMPWRSLARKISPFVDYLSDFTPGNTSKVFTIGKARIAPIICFELLDDEIVQNAAKNADIFAVQTNSATFGKSAESAQQLAITRIRAIEHSRNVLSVSTTGYSAVIDYQGEILQKTKMGVAANIYADVDLINELSPRDRYGDWSLVATLLWLLLIARRAYIHRR
jgi:apolipoprotein N-acyltransferase